MKKYIITIKSDDAEQLFYGIPGLKVKNGKVFYKGYVISVNDLEGALFETYMGRYGTDKGAEEWIRRNPKQVYKQFGNMIGEGYKYFKSKN